MADMAGKTSGQGTRSPHSWAGIGLGLAACAVCALLCATLVRQYLASRPLNLREYTQALADQVEELLLANRVEAGAITRSEPVLQADAEASWLWYAFRVQTSAALNRRGLAGLIGRTMLRYNVSVAESFAEESGPGVIRLSLTLGDREFAAVALERSEERASLSMACSGLADEVGRFLAARVPASRVDRAEPEPAEDATRTWLVTRFTVLIPSPIPVEALARQLETALESRGARVAVGLDLDVTAGLTVSYKDVACVEVAVEPPPPWMLVARGAPLAALPPPGIPGEAAAVVAETPALKPGAGRPRPRIAIILDDAGYGGAVTRSVLELDPALTLAILPGAPFAADTARRATEAGFQVLLHMPMESPEDLGWLHTDMSDEEIARATAEALAGVPGAAGVNNHAGSIFTANRAAVSVFLKQIKGKPLFLVDSRTTPDSKLVELGRQNGIRCAARDIFLDNTDSPEYIRGQLESLVARARENGQAVGIGHFRSATVRALAEALPTLNDVELVHVSELAQ